MSRFLIYECSLYKKVIIEYRKKKFSTIIKINILCTGNEKKSKQYSKVENRKTKTETDKKIHALLLVIFQQLK